MTDPKRLIDELDAGFERDLLLLAGSERPETALRERVEARVLEVGAATMAAGLGAGGGTALGKTGSSLGLLVVKWLGIGALAGGAVAAGGVEISARLQPPSEPVKVTEADSRRGARSPATKLDPAGLPSGAAIAETEIRGDPKQVRGEVVIGRSATLLEAESLRAAELEAKKNPKRALALVRQHIARFPDGATLAQARRLERELSRDPK